MVLWILGFWELGRASPGASAPCDVDEVSQWHRASEWACQDGPRRLCSQVVCLDMGWLEGWAQCWLSIRTPTCGILRIVALDSQDYLHGYQIHPCFP